MLAATARVVRVAAAADTAKIAKAAKAQQRTSMEAASRSAKASIGIAKAKAQQRTARQAAQAGRGEAALMRSVYCKYCESTRRSRTLTEDLR